MDGTWLHKILLSMHGEPKSKPQLKYGQNNDINCC